MFDVSLWAKRVIYKLISGFCVTGCVLVLVISLLNTDSLDLLLKNHMMDSILALFGKLCLSTVMNTTTIVICSLNLILHLFAGIPLHYSWLLIKEIYATCADLVFKIRFVHAENYVSGMASVAFADILFPYFLSFFSQVQLL